MMLGFNVSHGEHCNAPTLCLETMCDWMKGGPFEPALQAILAQDVQAVLDDPYCHAYKELAQRLPDAKVILTVRDNPTVWLRSFEEMQARVFRRNPARTIDDLGYWQECDQYAHTFIDCPLLGEPPSEAAREKCKSGYLRHIAEVQRSIAPERLLVFNVKEGWAPLVAFLGVPAPPVPFPHSDPFMSTTRLVHNFWPAALRAAALAIGTGLLRAASRWLDGALLPGRTA